MVPATTNRGRTTRPRLGKRRRSSPPPRDSHRAAAAPASSTAVTMPSGSPSEASEADKVLRMPCRGSGVTSLVRPGSAGGAGSASATGLTANRGCSGRPGEGSDSGSYRTGRGGARSKSARSRAAPRRRTAPSSADCSSSPSATATAAPSRSNASRSSEYAGSRSRNRSGSAGPRRTLDRRVMIGAPDAVSRTAAGSASNPVMPR